MLKERAQVLLGALRAVELGLWTLAFFASLWLRTVMGEQLTWVPEASGIDVPVSLLAVSGVLWLATSWMFELGTSHRIRPMGEELFAVAKATASVFVGLLLFVFMVHLPMPSRVFVVLYCLLAGSWIAMLRYGVRLALRQARTWGYNYRNLVVVGDGKLADGVAEMVKDHRQWGLRFVGFIAKGRPETTKHGKILGDVSNIADILDSNVVDEVIFAVEKFELDEMEDALRACEETGVNTRVVLNFFPHRISRPELTDLEGLPLLSFHATSNASAALVAKRVFDVAVSLTVLTLMAPILLVVALLVKLTSPGPVFFVQERVGQNGRSFKMYKFRSMVVDAEDRLKELQKLNEMDGPAFKIKDDPRITAIGRFIRKTSLDEFPQFFNVLRGEMSVVGPRPPLVREVAEYERWQRRRLSVKPGITCTWQISGRNDVSFDEWMRMDLEYIEGWTLRQDIIIVLRTVPAIVMGKGAC